MTKSPIPTDKDLLWPTLKALEGCGGSASIQELSEQVATDLALPDEILNILHQDGPQSKVDYHGAWARTLLKFVGAIDNTTRGIWTITEVGRRIKTEHKVRDLVSQELAKQNKERQSQSAEPGAENDNTPSETLNEDRLRAAIRLFRWIYGEDPFQSERYFEWERQYKVDLTTEWQATVTEDRLNAAIEGGAPLPYAAEVSTLFTKTNLLPWRYSMCIKDFGTPEKARTFLEALRVLLFDQEVAAAPIDAFNDHMRPLYDAYLREGAIKPASHSIPSLALWLSDPQHHFFIRPEVVNRAARILTGGVLEGQVQVMTSAYYSRVLALTQTVRSDIAELRPRDMIDVQGFLWGVFSRASIWFGGKSYGGSHDMFPTFLEKGVYGVGWPTRLEIAKYFREDISALKKGQRDARQQEFMEHLSPEERKGLAPFIKLLASPDSVLLAKSTWYDKGVEQSLFRISGVCVTGKGYTFDSKDGHLIPVNWLSRQDYVAPSGSYFPKIVSTLAELPLEDALTLIGPEPIESYPPPEIELPSQPRYTLEDFATETRFAKNRIQDWERKLRRKMHIVFQGPPGTGKTFVAERMARLLLSESIGYSDTVQFHPSYAYEDFMQGIHPQVEDGELTYRIQAGRFLEFCEEARKRDAQTPCVLIIDEINRANLSRVFGELMYLLEYRDKAIPLAVGGEKFNIPANVYLIGTMNTADRSIALVDHALRRRFAFIYLPPDYEVLKARLEEDGLPSESLISTLERINREIDDRNYELGISFFMNEGKNLRTMLPDIWTSEIEPYLEEYFYDRPAKVEAFRWLNLSTGALKDWAGQAHHED